MNAAQPPAVVLEIEPAPEKIGLLEDRLYAFNVEATGIADGQSFGLFLCGADGTVVGGAYGWSWGDTCYLQLSFRSGRATQPGSRHAAYAVCRAARAVALLSSDRAGNARFPGARFYRNFGFRGDRGGVEGLSARPPVFHDGQEAAVAGAGPLLERNRRGATRRKPIIAPLHDGMGFALLGPFKFRFTRAGARRQAGTSPGGARLRRPHSGRMPPRCRARSPAAPPHPAFFSSSSRCRKLACIACSAAASGVSTRT